MKMTVDELRKIVREEYLRGVPEFVFREATKKYVDDVRKHVKTFILQNKSNDFIAQREAIDTMNDIMEKLEEEVNALLEDKLFTYVQNV